MQIENSGVGRILRQLRWVLYPRRCPFCDRVLGSVSACPDCKEELETLRRRPTFRLARERHYIKNLEGAAAPYRYAGCVRRGVLRAKFQAAPWAADELGVEMARLLFGSKVRMRGFGPEVETVPGLAIGYNCVVPVPASSRVGVPLEPRLLVRARSGKRQEGLSFDERLVNVSGAFRVTDPEQVAGKRILLVDDVITTGATVTACTQALLAAGAESVFAVALATVELDAPRSPTEAILENSEEDF